MIKYKLTEEAREKLLNFLEPSASAIVLLNQEELNTDEINTILAVLGKFPAAIVYPLIEDLKISLNPIEDGTEK